MASPPRGGQSATEPVELRPPPARDGVDDAAERPAGRQERGERGRRAGPPVRPAGASSSSRPRVAPSMAALSTSPWSRSVQNPSAGSRTKAEPAGRRRARQAAVTVSGRRNAKAVPKASSVDQVELEPLVGRLVVGDPELVRAVAGGRESRVPDSTGDEAESAEVARGDEDVDVAWPAVELGFAAQQAPLDPRVLERHEQRLEPWVDLGQVRLG